MAVKKDANPALSHFGRQVRKERGMRGWSLDELAARTGMGAGHWSRIENGKRPPTEAVAIVCDKAFPERRGWFLEYYEDSKSSIPAGLRSWGEYEDKAVRLYVWSPGVLHGLVQTEDYARTFLAALPGVTDDVLRARLASRTARQQRILYREDPPMVWFLVDHMALYRCVGSPAIMADQMRHLAKIASMPHVQMQVLPAIAHPATASELILADNSAAYCEHLAAGGVYTEDDTVSRLERLFTTIQVESYRASESAAIIGRAEEVWTGESQATAAATDRASK